MILPLTLDRHSIGPLALANRLPAYTGQDQLIRSRDTSQSIEFMNDARARVRQRGKAIINEVFEKEGVNLIGAPGDSPLCVHAAAAG